MIRKHWHYDAAATKTYFKLSDYHAPVTGEWWGRDAERLGLAGQANKDDFDKLCDNINPLTGESLTKFTRDGRRVALELNFNAVKDAGIAEALAGRENRGDPMVLSCHKQAVKKALEFLEPHMQTCLREGDKNDSMENRTTGGMIAFLQTHKETRVNDDDFTPDMSLHDHVLIFNATMDEKARSGRGAWKAIEAGEIVKKLPLAEAIYHNEMARLLQTVGGYGIRREGKAYGIVGISKELRERFSRRTTKIKRRQKELEEQYGVELTAEAASKLGATTRLGKTKMVEGELHDYWLGKLSLKEKVELQRLKGRPSHVCDAATAVGFAIEHEFHRQSVVREEKLLETAIRRGIGLLTPAEIQAEAIRQGVLFMDGEATTETMRRQEREICDVTRRGRGKCRPVVADRVADVRQLMAASGERQAAIRLTDEQESCLRALAGSRGVINVVDAGQGTGKTTMLEHYGKILAGAKVGATWLGTTHTAVDELKARGLRAMTVAHFLQSTAAQRVAVGTRIIVDESSMLAHRDAYELFMYAKQRGCRIDLVGDSKQYKTPSAGNPMALVVRFGGVTPITMTKTMRQTGKLKEAMEAIRDGNVLKGHDILNGLGFVHEMPLDQLAQKAADLYLRWSAQGKDVPVISPTWAQAEEIAGKIRSGLRARGDLEGRDRIVRRLINLNWSPAQIKDARTSGAEEGVTLLRYGAYREDTQALAVGDQVKTTMGGRTKDGKHTLRNGQKFRIAGFTKNDDPILDNGAVVDKDWGGLVQRYVSTGQGAQGITASRGIVVYGTPSLVATRQEGFYVPVSRVRMEVAVLTDSNAELRRAIQKQDSRKFATELFEAAARRRRKPPLRQRLGKHLAYLRRIAAFTQTHEARRRSPERTPALERENVYVR
ncbi:MAG TPA: MobF family relaxase [Gemmataceae bacterium]|nr:MobF family relaxase [Gemmataceae bacterium]